MRMGPRFLVLAGLLGSAPACLLDLNDDDGAATSTDAAVCTTTAGGSGTATADTADTTATATDDTAAEGGCGWGPTGEPSVPEGYVCDGDGEDPSGTIPLLCPAEIDLQMGGACGDIAGPGCCDAQGNVWFCGDAGRGPALIRIEC